MRGRKKETEREKRARGRERESREMGEKQSQEGETEMDMYTHADRRTPRQTKKDEANRKQRKQQFIEREASSGV